MENVHFRVNARIGGIRRDIRKRPGSVTEPGRCPCQCAAERRYFMISPCCGWIMLTMSYGFLRTPNSYIASATRCITGTSMTSG